jgi:hypothetical protein
MTVEKFLNEINESDRSDSLPAYPRYARARYAHNQTDCHFCHFALADRHRGRPKEASARQRARRAGNQFTAASPQPHRQRGTPRR